MTSQATVARFPSVDSDQGAGARIRARRKALGMSAVKLADKAHVSREHLSAVENGHKEPTPEWERRVELAMNEYAVETGQEEPATPATPAPAETPMRVTFHDVFGIGEIIVEGPTDKDELVAMAAKLMAELRKNQSQ